jgi:hypothetical protein
MTGNGVRRVVTGRGGPRPAVAEDCLVEPVVAAALPGYSWHRIWSLDQPPAARKARKARMARRPATARRISLRRAACGSPSSPCRPREPARPRHAQARLGANWSECCPAGRGTWKPARTGCTGPRPST